MTEFVLNMRPLAAEEKIILFGKSPSKNLEAFKVLDVDNYIDLFEAIYTGKEVFLNALRPSDQVSRVYVYCDLPAGSRYFSEELTQYNGTLRSDVYDTPIAHIKSRMNEFLIPLLTNCLETFPNFDKGKLTAGEYYGNFNVNYSKLFEVLLAGCFLNVVNNKVISIASFEALKSLSQIANAEKLHTLQPSTVELENIWMYTQFLIPKVGSLLEQVPANEFIKNPSTYLRYQKSTTVTDLASLYSWASDSGTDLVIADSYLKLNGYYSFNNKKYIGLANTWFSPIHERSSGQGSSSSRFTEAFETYLYSPKINTNQLFGFTSSGSNSYASNNGSFIFVNGDRTELSVAEEICGLPELVELDKEFLTSVSDILEEAKQDPATDLKSSTGIDKIRKREFAIKREALVSESAASNSRYITLTSSDGKLFILTKTSKAKEAARKMAITRKITAAVQPVIDMAIRIFAATDFETGISTSRYRFPFSSKRLFDLDAKAPMPVMNLNTFNDSLIHARKSFSSHNQTCASNTINDIYKVVNYTGTPFANWHPSPCSGYKSGFLNLTSVGREGKLLEYLYDLVKTNLLTNYMTSNLFSPSSGLLDIVNLGNNIYKSHLYNTFSPEFTYLRFKDPYGRETALTGKQLYYMYVNNFIGDTQQTTDEIERNKESDYISVSNRMVAATTAFTFSDPAVASIKTLKKSKTFADYNDWFISIRPELDLRLETLFKLDDEPVYKTMLLVLDHFSSLLELLKVEEVQYLPKEDKVKRGRKKKADTSEVTDDSEEVVSELEEVSTPEEQAIILARLQSLATLSIGVK